jgi:hypothetical protein
MANAKNWAHYSQSILKVGRTAHLTPEVQEGEEEEVLMRELEERDPSDKRLKAITLDSAVNVAGNANHPAWIVKLMGDKNVY